MSVSAELAAVRRWLLGCPDSTVHSFDVFDTMVTRVWARPSDLFLVLGTVLHRQGLIPMSPVEFADARHAAELAARKAHTSGETTLDEIYRQFAWETGVASDRAAAIAEGEVEMETNSVRSIAAVTDLVTDLAAAGRQVVLASDTYLSSQQLAAILTSLGVDPERTRRFPSSEHRASKRNGQLYQVIRQACSAPVYTHFGDRRTADLENARAAGFDSHIFSGQAPSRRESELGAGRWTDPTAASAASGCARAARLQSRSGDVRIDTIRAVSANVAGPLLCAFVAWVLRSAAEDGIDRLLFLARDGQILQRIATRLAPAMGVAVDCRYTYASRQALYLPSARAVGDPSWTWLSAKMEGRTADQILARFELDGTTSPELHDLLRDAGSRVFDASLASELRRLLETDEVAARVLDEAAKRRALVRQYFTDESDGAGRTAIVDLGWKGRLQVCLERILDTDPEGDTAAIDGYYFGLDELATAPPRGRRTAFAAYRKLPNIVLLECFTLADHGSLLGFRRSDDGSTVEPVLAAPDETSIAWGLSEQQAAIMDFTEFFLDAANIAGFEVDRALADLTGPALKGFADFVRSPSLAEAAAYGDLEHSDDQAHQGASPIAAPLALPDVVSLALRGSDRPGRRVSYWPQASLRRFAETSRPLAFAIGLIARCRALADRVVSSLRRTKRALRLRRQVYLEKR